MGCIRWARSMSGTGQGRGVEGRKGQDGLHQVCWGKAQGEGPQEVRGGGGGRPGPGAKGRVGQDGLQQVRWGGRHKTCYGRGQRGRGQGDWGGKGGIRADKMQHSGMPWSQA